MYEHGRDCIQQLVEALANILRKKSQDKIFVLLQQRILSSIPPVGLGVSQMLRAIQLDGVASASVRDGVLPPAVVFGPDYGSEDEN